MISPNRWWLDNFRLMSADRNNGPFIPKHITQLSVEDQQRYANSKPYQKLVEYNYHNKNNKAS